MTIEWFAAVAPGLEAMLVAELRELGLGASSVEGGALVRGDRRAGWTVAIRSRVAAGLVARVGVVRAQEVGALTAAVRKLGWVDLVHPAQEVEVKAASGAPGLRGHQIEGAVRRGIAESLRGPRLPGRRPPREPARVAAREVDGAIELSIDAAGELLHRRGWRLATAKAPIRENLAAALLRLAGWRPDEPLLDPMCGSGTFPIEAAQWAMGLPPGGRRRFAFEDWPSHDDRAYARVRDDRPRPLATNLRISGSDRDPGAIRASVDNARRAGVGGVVRFDVRDLRDLAAPAASGLLVCNPPWGDRVSPEDARPAWAALGRVARERFEGWRIAVIGPSADLARATGLRLSAVTTFPSGGVRVTAWIGAIR